MKHGTEYWLATSDYDFDTAKAMLTAKRYVYVVFMCHLCLEKLLKGALVELTDIETPPRIHSLEKLTNLAKLDVMGSHLDFLKQLTLEQQRTRYPLDAGQLGRTYTRTYAEKVFKLTREFRKWLLPQLKSVE